LERYGHHLQAQAGLDSLKPRQYAELKVASKHPKLADFACGFTNNGPPKKRDDIVCFIKDSEVKLVENPVDFSTKGNQFFGSLFLS